MIIERDLLEKIKECTETEYNWYPVEEKVFVPEEDAKNMLKNLIYELKCQKKLCNALKKEIENDYTSKEIDYYKEYGISEDNFH
jgi:hypothetical protein